MGSLQNSESGHRYQDISLFQNMGRDYWMLCNLSISNHVLSDDVELKLTVRLEAVPVEGAVELNFAPFQLGQFET